MTLKEKITKDVLDMPLINSPTKKEISDYEKGISNLEKIADEFAIEFAKWICEKAEVPYIKGTMNSTLEIYKKEKGL
jgi:hypothetical protein